MAALASSPMEATVVSLAEAHRLTGVSREVLRAAVVEGRLPAAFGRREGVRRGSATHWLISRPDLRAFVDAAPSCRYPGCEQPGLSSTGCCCGPHAIGVLTVGKKRDPAVTQKMSAALRGVLRGPRSPEWAANIAAGVQRYYNSDRSARQRTESSLRMLDSWESGNGAAPAVLRARARGLARSRYFGRWNGHKGAAAGIEAGRAKGGRPPACTPEQQVEMLRLSKQGFSTREIAAAVFGDARFKDRVARFLAR